MFGGSSHPDDLQDVKSDLMKIFRFLQAVNQQRNPPQRHLNKVPTIGFHDLPEHPCIQRGRADAVVDAGEEDGESDGDDFILKVSRPVLTEPPSPPTEIADWLHSGWQNVDAKIAVKETLDEESPTPIRFADNPARPSLLKRWTERWQTWAEKERPARRVFDLYNKLYQWQSDFEREGDRNELLLGDGRLLWLAGSVEINYPLLLLRLQLTFNPHIPEFTLTETGQLTELYTASFQSLSQANPNNLGKCREEIIQQNYHPLGGREVDAFLQKVVVLLHPHGQLTHALPSQASSIPQVARDPVIFIRPRTQGINAAIESILEDIPNREEIAYALASLTGIVAIPNEHQGSTAIQRNYDQPNGEDEHILLSKPANAEQLEIARTLEEKGAVLVQGPPGTGKTHTIANLIGHYLAQGKRVLVTSEKAKALRVLREKVVPPLQPLCAAIMSDDSRKEMEETINEICERLATQNPSFLERQANTLERERLSLLQQLIDARRALTTARWSEYGAIGVAGESYNPSSAARLVAQRQEKDGWIPAPIVIGAALPLQRSELVALYSSNATVTWDDEYEIGYPLPELNNILTPTDFEQKLVAQQQISLQEKQYRQDLWIPARSGLELEDISHIQSKLTQELSMMQHLAAWNQVIVAAGREGGARYQIWVDLIGKIEHVDAFAAQAQLRLLERVPVIAADCLPDRLEKTLHHIIHHLKQGKQMGFLTLATKSDWKAVLEKTTVNGKRPSTLEDFEALATYVQLSALRQDLLRRWERQVTSLGGPALSELGPEPEHRCLQYVPTMKRYLQWYADSWEPLERSLRQQGLRWEVLVAETQSGTSEIVHLQAILVQHLPAIIAAEIQRRRDRKIDQEFFELIRYLEQTGGGVQTRAEVVQQLESAAKSKNSVDYRWAYQRLQDLHSKRKLALQRQSYLTKLEAVAPAWANAVRKRIGIHGEPDVPGDPADAWLWRQLNDELDRRSKISLSAIQEKLNGLTRRLFQVTAELVEKRAWAMQIRNTTPLQQSALQDWRTHMKKLGKGTGKRAPIHRAEARKLMPICQTAVPVWIMPLNYVAQNFDMKRNRFDVVIIDEASQAGLSALLAVYLGRQVVVVGDEEQVSPLDVGQSIEMTQKLINEHLRGIAHAQLFDGRLSICDLAKRTFRLVALQEHFRCVAPIIQFSNELSYHGKIKPLRDDSEVVRRPFVLAYYVPPVLQSGSVHQEARVVASLLIAASEQPEYRDATFGVISMVSSSDQASTIEKLLQQYMPPTEYTRRRVLCGDPAQFQGDERDVMFLAMVDLPTGRGPLSMRSEESSENMWKKRFNVAASRARDQMWVVHSIDPETDLQPGDIRQKLITYARYWKQHEAEWLKKEQQTESEFEKQVLQRLIRAGYQVIPQWRVGAYRIDMVVESHGQRLAIECDGDRYHQTPEKLEEDMARQAILERLGWRFVRIRGSQFFRDPDAAIQPVFERLQALNILPTRSTEEAPADDEQLKERIIRRAYELRQRWQTQGGSLPIEGEKIISSSDALSKKIGNAEAGRTVRLEKQPLLATNIHMQAERTPISQQPVSRADQPPRSRVQDIQSIEGKLPGNRIRESSQANSTPSFNPILFLQTKGIHVIDRRDKGGGIWVAGGEELRTTMDFLAKRGYQFRFYPGGLRLKGDGPAHTTDGWFIKSL
ncbi:MAG TPA: AAA domain-containing protein [Ktedonobacteraceae bacterium]|nr:AAA domain-containing protein [Ktedonobacteraceae bacterium]